MDYRYIVSKCMQSDINYVVSKGMHTLALGPIAFMVDPETTEYDKSPLVEKQCSLLSTGGGVNCAENCCSRWGEQREV